MLRLVHGSGASAGEAGCPTAQCVGWPGTLSAGPQSNARLQVVPSHRDTTVTVFGNTQLPSRVWNPNALWRMLYLPKSKRLDVGGNSSKVGVDKEQALPVPNKSFVLVPVTLDASALSVRANQALLLSVQNDVPTTWHVNERGVVCMDVVVAQNGASASADTVLGASLRDADTVIVSNTSSFMQIGMHAVLQRVFVPTHCTDNMQASGVACLGQQTQDPEVVRRSRSLFCCDGLCGRTADPELGYQAACVCSSEVPLISNTINCATCEIGKHKWSKTLQCTSCHSKEQGCPGVGIDLLHMTQRPVSSYGSVAELNIDDSVFSASHRRELKERAAKPVGQRHLDPHFSARNNPSDDVRSGNRTVDIAPPLVLGEGGMPFVRDEHRGYYRVVQNIGPCDCPFASSPLVANHNDASTASAANITTRPQCTRCHPQLCKNGGMCDAFTGSCICPSGFFGPHCEQRMQDTPPVRDEDRDPQEAGLLNDHADENFFTSEKFSLLVTGVLAAGVLGSLYLMKKSRSSSPSSFSNRK